MKQKKCKVCKKEYKPFNSLQKACSPKCALKLVEQQKEKAKSAEIRERKRKLNDTVPNWKKKAQAAFNKYIRLRDRDLPCVSCGKYEHEIKHDPRGGIWDCGHYRSVGSAPELRFEEDNAHKQCKHCNQFLSGNHVEYRFGIARRLSSERLEWIEGPHEKKRYRVEELKQIERLYKAKAKEIEALLKL